MDQNPGSFSPLLEIDLNSIPEFEETNFNLTHHSLDINSIPSSEDDSEPDEDDQFYDQENAHARSRNGAASGVIRRNSKPYGPYLQDDKRRQIFEATLARSEGLRLPYGVTNTVANLFSVNVRTVRRIWKRGRDCIIRSEVVDVRSRRSKNCGRKRVCLDPNVILAIPLCKRSTIRDLVAAANVGKHTIENSLKSGEIRRHTNSIKPFLTERNKKARLEWCLSMLDPRSIPHDPVFKAMFDISFIDEKWFNMTQRTGNYYLSSVEEEPLRTCKSTNFIGKVMFLAAVARPRMDENGNCTIDGKIGCFPLVDRLVAQRNSIHRRAGTVEMKPIQSINKDVVRSYLMEKILPAIRVKWPREDGHYIIYIQQDNALAHIDPNDQEFCEVAKQDGFDIRLICQPLNSPDLNVLDLVFFRAIQSIQYKQRPKSTAELVDVVEKAFEEFSPILSNRIFVTLQACMIEIMKAKGSNHYKIPHLKKDMLEREERLPLNLKCDQNLVNEVFRHIDP